MIPSVGTEPELSDFEMTPVLLCMQSMEQDADNNAPSQYFSRFSFPSVPIQSGIPLGSISVTTCNQDDPCWSITEKLEIEIELCPATLNYRSLIYVSGNTEKVVALDDKIRALPQFRYSPHSILHLTQSNSH
jgi:hypothetical protein